MSEVQSPEATNLVRSDWTPRLSAKIDGKIVVNDHASILGIAIDLHHPRALRCQLGCKTDHRPTFGFHRLYLNNLICHPLFVDLYQ